MRIACITATCGRHRCVERIVSFFINQDYEDDHLLLIYNNSSVDQELSEIDLPPNKQILLVNNYINLRTSENYSNLGDIYTDALTFIPDEYQVITFMDDDDIFLTNHLSAGAEGLKRALEKNQVAYKPAKSYYKHQRGTDLMSNTLEPSIFVLKQHVQNYGFSPVTTEQHLSWVNPLVINNLILVDPNGLPTLIYDWSQTIPTFKTSGDYKNPGNFNNYRTHSRDHGDRIITPTNVETLYNITHAKAT